MTTTNLRGLHPGARLLLLVLEDMADEHREVRASSGELLEATGWTNRSTVRKRTTELEGAGLVQRVPVYGDRGGRMANVYRLTEKG